MEPKSHSPLCLKLGQAWQSCLLKINTQVTELTYCTGTGILHRFHIVGVGVARSQPRISCSMRLGMHLSQANTSPLENKGESHHPCYIPKKHTTFQRRAHGKQGNSTEQNMGKKRNPSTAPEKSITDKLFIQGLFMQKKKKDWSRWYLRSLPTWKGWNLIYLPCYKSLAEWKLSWTQISLLWKGGAEIFSGQVCSYQEQGRTTLQ